MFAIFLNENEIELLNYHKFKKLTVLNMPLNNKRSFSETLKLFEDNDLSEMIIYNKQISNDGAVEYDVCEKLIGFSKIDNFMNNFVSGECSITLAKKNQEDVADYFIENNKLGQIEYMLSCIIPSLSDEQALNCVDLFAAYEVNHVYAAGDRFKYNGNIYKVLQDHTSQEDLRPDEAMSLYVNIANPVI